MFNKHKSKTRIILLFVLVALLLGCRDKPEVDAWYIADNAIGSWKTEVVVLISNITNDVMYKSECDNKYNCFVQQETCVAEAVRKQPPFKSDEERGEILHDPREDFTASNEFLENEHIIVEFMKIEREKCEETDKPAGDGQYYLKCPTFKRKTYYQIIEELKCTVELTEFEVQSRHELTGNGREIIWQEREAPDGGKVEYKFKSSVTVYAESGKMKWEFDGIRSEDEYLSRLTEQQYIGVNEDGKPVIAGTKAELSKSYQSIKEVD